MENKKNLLKILESSVNTFFYKTVVNAGISENEIFILLLNENKCFGEDNLLMNYIAFKKNMDMSFFTQGVRDVIIRYAGYNNMYRLLNDKSSPIFSKEDLEFIYKTYGYYEIRNLVETKMWSEDYIGKK